MDGVLQQQQQKNKKKSKAVVRGNGDQLEELLSLSQLISLKKSFESHTTGRFRCHDFTEVILPMLGRKTTANELESWFHRIDLAGTGSVSWDDFSGYLMQRNNQKIVQEDSKFEYSPQTECHRSPEEFHHDMATCTLVHPNTGKVFTCSRDGVLKQWAAGSLQHEKILHNTGTWVTELNLMKQESRMIVTSVDRQLDVIDLTNGNLLCTYAGQKHACERKATRVRNQYDVSKFGVKVDFARQPQTSLDSSTTIVQFASSLGRTLVGHSQAATSVPVYPLCELSSTPMSQCCFNEPLEYTALGLSDGTLQIYPLEPNSDGLCEYTCKYALHQSTVSKLKYSNYLSGVISSSWDGSLKIFNVEKQAVSQHFTHVSGSKKAVFSFDWSESLQILASCGSERRAYIWNPFLSQPVFKIDGHQQPLVGVALNSQHGQVLTLAVDKSIKVWDVRTFKCLQTITDTTNYHPENSITSFTFDSQRERIITSATYPTAWPLSRVSPNFPPLYCGHHAPILAALYDPKLRQILSVDRHQLSAWSFENGQKLCKFKLSKQLPQQRLGQHITKAVQDPRGTRLITATDKGSIVVWNLQNCQVCAVGTSPENSGECTALLHCLRKDGWYIYAALGHLLYVYEDFDDLHHLKPCGRFSTGSLDGKLLPVITSLLLCTPSLLALGLDDSRILLYNPDINHVCGTLCNRYQGVSIEQLVQWKENILLAGRTDGVILFCDIPNRCTVFSFNCLSESETSLCSLAATVERDRILIGDSEGFIHVWNVTGQLDAEFVATQSDTFRAHSEGVSSAQLAATCEQDCAMAFSGAEYRSEPCVVTGSLDCYVKIFTLTGKLIGIFGLGSNEWNMHNEATWGRQIDPSAGLPATSRMVQSNVSTTFFSNLFNSSGGMCCNSSNVIGGETESEPDNVKMDNIPLSELHSVHLTSVPRPPPRRAFQPLEAPFAVCPGRHILNRRQKIHTILRKPRAKENSAIVAGLMVVVAEVFCEDGLYVPKLNLSKVFVTELPHGELSHNNNPIVSKTSRGGSIGTDVVRLRIEQRLARHGMALTSRQPAANTDWAAKGTEVLRQIRLRKAKLDKEQMSVYKYNKMARSSLGPIPRPSAPNPPANWKPANCTLCALEKSHTRKHAKPAGHYLTGAVCHVLPEEHTPSPSG